MATTTKPLPTFVQVTQALQSTGITLCSFGPSSNLIERQYGWTSDGNCADSQPGSGIISIFTEANKEAAQNDLELMKSNPPDDVAEWIDDSIAIVWDTPNGPAPGTNTALEALGFTQVQS